MPDTTVLDTLLDETRVFPPSEQFRSTALCSTQVLYEAAARDREGFWVSFAEQLDWYRHWNRVLEWKPPRAKWFVGGEINAAVNCLDRHIGTGRRNKAALIWEGEPG